MLFDLRHYVIADIIDRIILPNFKNFYSIDTIHWGLRWAHEFASKTIDLSC